MSTIKEEDIIGIRTNEKIVCVECASEDALEEASFDELLTADEVERSNEWFFCDDCGKRIR